MIDTEEVQRARENFGKRVRRARLSKRWTQAALAMKAGLVQQKVSEVEGGKVKTLGIMVTIADALGVPLAELLDDGECDDGLA